MNLEKELDIVTNTYQSSVKRISSDLFYMNRKHEYTPPTQIVDIFGNFNIYAYADVKKEELCVTANSQSFHPHGPISIFIPKLSLVKWDILSSHLEWHAYVSDINFAPQWSDTTLFSGYIPRVSSVEDISAWLGTAEVVKTFSKRENASLASKVKEYIDVNFLMDIEISEIAKTFNLSDSQLTKIFKSEFSISPVKYRSKIRVFQSMFDLLTKKGSVIDLALETGFSDLSRFNKQFKSITKSTPSKFKFNPIK